MLFTITGKHIEITDAIRDHAEKKTSKLPRYYDNISQIEVIIDSSEGSNINVEIIAHAEHHKVFVGTDASQDAYQSIDMAVHKLEGQLRKAKGKERDNKHTNDKSAESEELI